MVFICVILLVCVVLYTTLSGFQTAKCRTLGRLVKAKLE